MVVKSRFLCYDSGEGNNGRTPAHVRSKINRPFGKREKMSDEKDIVMTEEFEEEEYSAPTVILTMDDDTEVVCEILDIFKIDEKDEQEYIALLPESDDPDNTDVYIYRFFEDEDGEPHIDNIETDEEYDRAADAFDALMDLDDDFDDEEEEFE